MLPSVMRWNQSANGPRQAMVAAAMGQAGQDAGDVLDAFIRGLGMAGAVSCFWRSAICSAPSALSSW